MDAAVQEMFSAVHMQLLARACRLDKLLLVALLLEMRASGARALRSVLRLASEHERVLCERLELRQRRAWCAHSVSRTSDAGSRGPGHSASAGDRSRVAAPAADGGSGCLRRPERLAAPWLPCAQPPRVSSA